MDKEGWWTRRGGGQGRVGGQGGEGLTRRGWGGQGMVLDKEGGGQGEGGVEKEWYWTRKGVDKERVGWTRKGVDKERVAGIHSAIRPTICTSGEGRETQRGRRATKGMRRWIYLTQALANRSG